MRFAIRDDDTSYFTDPERLERLYGRIMRSAPISLAVTPFALQCFHRGDLDRYYQAGDYRPLADNRELVAWLRSRIAGAEASVLCHGYSHEYLSLPPRRRVQEYLWKPPARMRVETALAKEHLESTLGAEITTFVPPGNAISRAGLEAVQGSFSNVLAAVSLRRWQDARLECGWLASYLRRAGHQIFHGIPNPRLERLAGVRLLPSFSLTRRVSWEQIAGRFQLCRRLGADFVVAVHYWELDVRLQGVLSRLLDLAADVGCEFAHCENLFLDSGSTSVAHWKEGGWAGSRIA